MLKRVILVVNDNSDSNLVERFLHLRDMRHELKVVGCKVEDCHITTDMPLKISTEPTIEEKAVEYGLKDLAQELAKEFNITCADCCDNECFHAGDKDIVANVDCFTPDFNSFINTLFKQIKC